MVLAKKNNLVLYHINIIYLQSLMKLKIKMEIFIIYLQVSQEKIDIQQKKKQKNMLVKGKLFAFHGVELLMLNITKASLLLVTIE